MDGLLKMLADSAAPLLAAAANAAMPHAAAPAPVVAPAAAAPIASISGVGLQILLEPTGGWVFRGACNTAAIIYPVYKSFKAIESKNPADDTQWLTYWTIYGSLLLLEHAGDSLLKQMPYYYHAKFALLLWLQMPQTQGASMLYNKYYKPTLTKYQDKIDLCIGKAQEVLMYMYEANKMPIAVALSVFAAIKEQSSKFVTWFLEDTKKDGAKAAAA